MSTLIPEPLEGLICKGVGGFYAVETERGLYVCKARGLFRKRGLTPLAGDRAQIAVTHEGDREAYIEAILPRKNALIRPPVANLERMFIVVAATSPEPSCLVIDKLIAICERKEIDPVLVVNKVDLDPGDALAEVYGGAGFLVLPVSAETGVGLSALEREIGGRLCAFVGHSGVGKSSLLNRLMPVPVAEVGALSEKLERGRHTTRHVELFSCAGGLIADTPGFGDLSLVQIEPLHKDEVFDCFREFAPYFGRCRFGGSCYHDQEPGCAVKQAVEDGVLARSRHESYLAMLHEVKDLKAWELP
ncbi:MAG: ribosome small subunit-dependent GTPase A [Clostridiales bacterium]|nr:ribosome small subunit-dependent GTPase A [Clostridiales bacterium]